MAENRTQSGLGDTTQQTGVDKGSSMSGVAGTTTGASAGTAAAVAQEYGHKISEAATHAREYVTDKVSVVGDKIKELQNADLGEVTENAKEYARKNPGQAILISAAAGLVLGLLLRGRR